MKYSGLRDGDVEGVSLRKSILGSHLSLSLQALGWTLGVFTAILLGAVLTQPSTSWTQPQLSIFLLGWLASIVAAGYVAYHNSGILVSWVLVLAPVVAQLVYFTWEQNQQGLVPATVGLGPFETFGTGAWLFWIPVAVLVGTIAFGFGVAIRWGKNTSNP